MIFSFQNHTAGFVRFYENQAEFDAVDPAGLKELSAGRGHWVSVSFTDETRESIEQKRQAGDLAEWKNVWTEWDQKITLVMDPDANEPNWPLEHCCFCWERSKHWAQPQDVACCQACAEKHAVADLPTKEEWTKGARERFPRVVRNSYDLEL